MNDHYPEIFGICSLSWPNRLGVCGQVGYLCGMAGKPGIRNLRGMRSRQKGGLPSTAAQIPGTGGQLKQLVPRFLSRMATRGYAQGSIELQYWALQQFLGWCDSQGYEDPADFTRSRLEEYQLFLFDYRSPRGGRALAINTQLSRLGCIRRFFAWLCRDGVLPANPAADLDLPRRQARALPKTLSSNEIDKLFKLPDVGSPFGLRDRCILELFYSCGVRRTEITKLEVGDYDAHARTLLVRRGKNGKSRLLPVGGHATAWLDRYLANARPKIAFRPAETALFLSGYGTAFSPVYLGNWVAKQMRKAGIVKGGACHLFRHSCATDMHRGGADIRYVQEMLGHARLDTTQIYTHLSIAALQEVHSRCHPHGRLVSCEKAMKESAALIQPETSSPDTEFTTNCVLMGAPFVPSVHAASRTDQNEIGVSTPAMNYSEHSVDVPPPRLVSNGRGIPLTSPKSGKTHDSFNCTSTVSMTTSCSIKNVTCYGYRYYNRQLGRWLSRDPIGERDGTNLYKLLANNAVFWIDVIGLKRFRFTFNILDRKGELTGNPDSPEDEAKRIPDARQVDSVAEILGFLRETVKPYSFDGKDPCNCVEELIIWTHGLGNSIRFGPGPSNEMGELSYNSFLLMQQLESREDFDPNNLNSEYQRHRLNGGELVRMLTEISSLLCTDGVVEIRACHSGLNDRIRQGIEMIFAGHYVKTFKGLVAPYGPRGCEVIEKIDGEIKNHHD